MMSFCLIKFGSEKHMESLLKNGELYFSTAESFKKSSNLERGDTYEGAEFIENFQMEKIKIEHKTIGTREFKTHPNKLTKFIQFNYEYLSYSLYAITPSLFENSENCRIDKRMLEFGESAVLINDPGMFLKDVFSKLKEMGNNRNFADFVKYRDFGCNGKIDVNPFIKKIEYQHQNEFRIITENSDDKPKLIKIGSIEDYSHLLSSKYLIESTLKGRLI